ncbi:MAG: mechanosensitive ion channel [Gammaproteobacteria bacterium]|nr:mechanosensitive ion channel [Gammaproteobacteria bacterium]MBU1624239.1 mechanosensitive ion channel [Gammaproteobacteria bacterium]MBU1981967.1 mechanosensitive ion channel [Gammaproteobacteria bacterium]
METLQMIYQTLEEMALMPWFAIADTQINLFRVLGLFLILFIVWRSGNAIESTLARIGRSHDKEFSPGWYALSRISRYVVWIIGLSIGLSYLGFSMSSFALIAGAIGIGVGFGLQSIISNFVSGIVILIEKIIKVGDFVDLQSGVMGRVTEINLRYTRVTTADLIDIIVPNSEFISGRVINWTLGERLRRLHVPFSVAYGTDKDLVREAAIAAAASVPGTEHTAGREPEAWLVKFGDSSLDFELVVWVGPELIVAPGKTQAKYLWAIEDELKKRKIEIPFPQRDLHIRSGTLAVSLNQNP